MIQTGISKTWQDFDRKLQKHETELLEQEAGLAWTLIAQWGMVAGMEDGEDSSGRAKGRIQTPTELIERAFTTANLFFTEARKRGLIHIAPDLADLNETKEQSEATTKQIADKILPVN